ncbi:MAG: hypothetical protein EXX96DRAFT_2016 [Benjaminiella poitrasii]|nr:MAG: hypothetical protein EXX96DRAFT_2016 [Benjaminiella poitrasii]
MFLHKEKAKPPRSLRSARLSVVKNQISTPIAQTSIASPKKVIKALYDYHAQSPHELSFTRGDFFLVTGRENDSSYYEAFNPITNSRGIVPVNCFQVLEKHERAMTDSTRKKGYIDQNEVQAQKKLQPLYGIVLYDFQAERLDELEAKAGEAIIIIAQSNAEWFVAKPIGRLGGPGLIPVSFVDIRDATTGQTVKNDVLQKTTIKSPVFPNVEEWKKQTQGYETSSISLDRVEKQMQDFTINDQNENNSIIDDYYTSDINIITKENNRLQYSDISMNNYSARPLSDTLPSLPATSARKEGPSEDGSTVISAYIDSYILEGDQYWFIVFVKLTNGKYRVLYRLYEDFYDFQINFLQEFPSEAGKLDQPRILPYMPGPLDTVNDDITADRARDLSKYCEDLLRLPRYLSESTWIQNQLFGIHEGDIETDIDPGIGRSISSGYNTNYGVTSNIVDNMNTTLPDYNRKEMPAIPVSTGASPSSATMSPNNSSLSTTTIKVKIMYKDEIFAIKVPIPNTVEFLKGKILDRLGFEAQLQYKSGDSLTELNADTFATATKLGKLTVVAS